VLAGDGDVAGEVADGADAAAEVAGADAAAELGGGAAVEPAEVAGPAPEPLLAVPGCGVVAVGCAPAADAGAPAPEAPPPLTAEVADDTACPAAEDPVPEPP
jgi:hypothetical protein